MRQGAAWARERFAAARVAVLATVTPAGAPHLVPIAFALAGDRLVTAVDAKPKSTGRLQRLTNIAAEPRVAVLVEAYDEDWSQLWWARADGRARTVPVTDDGAALSALARKYPTYAATPPPGPLIDIAVERWSGWSAR